MASIKTKELNKGSIKTIDRASMMTQHIKRSNVKLKDQAKQDKDTEAVSPDNYAQDRVSEYGKVTSKRAGVIAYDVSVRSAKRLRQKKELIEIRNRKDSLVRNRDTVRSSSADLHLPKIKTSTEAQKLSAVKAANTKAILDKTKRDAAAKNSVRIKNAAKKAQKGARKLSKNVVRSLKAMIESAKAMFLALGAAGSVAVIIVLICVLFGAAFYFFGDESSSSYTPVSPEVEAYTPVIQKYADKYGIPEYTELIKAVMMQESGGKGNDPMQCSECGLNTKYPHKPNSIKDPEYSIEVGINYIANLLKRANCKSPLDLEHIRLALQSYNYGSGYLSWAVKRDGGYTVENAAAFSDQQAKKHGWDSYGDISYVEHVMRYYPYGNYSYDVEYTGTGRLGLPIKGMTRGHITSHFGPRVSPGGIGSTNHLGLDIGFPTGTHVLACESGSVTLAGWNGGYGNCIIIDHGKGIQTVYGHLSAINVKTGQKVVRGQYIGNVGSTGNSTGPHLHLGVMLNGRFVNLEKGWLDLK